ncbi:hypothetical protein [Phyllobacterium myrsinacearum]|uniref:Uncharacterized protein n=1 Tax=Phyllobacterium myrsinacearum TaxID=28101 RepID=A0A839F074_9HYPH|nr:hypothetical protein [Phyllobacterium myrsinacearum]MBA8882080.1 hypothetical protein [Phyllobacterium myrsinacearum]
MSEANLINSKFRHVRLVLAREKAHPCGDDHEGYDLLLPLDEDGQIDVAEWRICQEKCRIRHFRSGQDERIGYLRRRPGGAWYFDYPDTEPDNERVFRFSDEHFINGEYVSIKTAGAMHTYRVVFVEKP